MGDAAIYTDDEDIDLSFRAVHPVELLVEQLHVGVDLSPNRWGALLRAASSENQASKSILKNINARMPPVTITAILGASGSGKTSLLNSLSHRIEGGRLKTRGRILYNQNSKISTIRHAYVMQQDILIPSLTVRETLQYGAELRLSSSMTAKERYQVVEEVILELGLKDCADTKIGNDAHRGCSGGERRRTSLGVQLLANPSVLFLDEVTTGLDASTAHRLVKTLKNLARKGRTIVMTIHQPRSEIWSLFDNVLVLAQGSLVYSGCREECLPYFETCGLKLPVFMNPAEFLIDQAAVDNRSPESEARSQIRIQELTACWERHITSNKKSSNDKRNSNERHFEHTTSGEKSSYDKPIGSEATPDFPSQDELIVSKAARAPSRPVNFLRQCKVLTRRTFKVTWRDPYGLLGSMLEAISMSAISGGIFWNLDGTLQGIRSREGALFLGTSLQSYLVMLYEIYRLTYDIQTFDRERGEGVINVPAWLLSRRIARFPLEDLPSPIIFSTIFYFMVGFRPDTDQFFIYFAILLLIHHISINVATFCVALRRDFAQASLIANTIFTVQSLAGGYFVQSNQIPVWIRWLKWTAYSFYAYSASAVNEFLVHTSDPAGQLYDCPYPGGTANPQCSQYTGRYIMQILEVPFKDLKRPFIILLGFTLVFFICSGAILSFVRVHLGMSVPRKTDTDFSAGKENMTAQSLARARTVTVHLRGFALDIWKRSGMFWKPKKLSILKPMDTDFYPSVLNVIMGPSGSGKTSLLNAMAQRMQHTLTTKYYKSGGISLNGAEPSLKVIRSICSFVCQDDAQLLPCLTVRENLVFAALLRLPSHFSRKQKLDRAESILLKMGLSDCANNVVGDELRKGISGGEKRRTTIACQILTDPQVLLLDEPTSGLDAFTASSIIDVLKCLASEGRTLILAIHQTRSDSFKHFENVLLLAQGGEIVYTGRGSAMLPYFASLGHMCPITTNPADFALDLISVNLQSESKETRTREKVRSLIHSWQGKQHSLNNEPQTIDSPAQLGSFARKMTPLRVALPALMHRSFINFKRNNVAVVARTMQILAYACILTLLFAPLGTSQASINARFGFLQEITPLYFIGMLQNVAVYPKERDVFYREHDDNAYSVEAFFLQYTFGEVPFEIVGSLVAATLLALATQLPRTIFVYLVMAFNCFAIVNVGESLGIMFNTLFTHTGFAVNMMSVAISIPTLMAGTMSLNVPAFLQALNHLSPLKWSLGNLAPYSFKGVTFHCEDHQRMPNGECPIGTGEEALKVYNFETNPALNLLALGVCVVAYRLLAYLILKVARMR
ncbi:uncharacterized protein KY384_006049 [Bacidia gigantensis]|uniref:uncharacterized protein n=1 Tax=Bacidia gigantensis TaxID=2732470 RepID=UPI001D03ED99|nr:uncharacterized protein KY384_006049 [Bacidia gigantensis]KAG8529412.1 hypothetical protein KY384_006049 [Bacidia gigantensis]